MLLFHRKILVKSIILTGFIFFIAGCGEKHNDPEKKNVNEIVLSETVKLNSLNLLFSPPKDWRQKKVISSSRIISEGYSSKRAKYRFEVTPQFLFAQKLESGSLSIYSVKLDSNIEPEDFVGEYIKAVYGRFKGEIVKSSELNLSNFKIQKFTGTLGGQLIFNYVFQLNENQIIHFEYVFEKNEYNFERLADKSIKTIKIN